MESKLLARVAWACGLALLLVVLAGELVLIMNNMRSGSMSGPHEFEWSESRVKLLLDHMHEPTNRR